MLDEKSIHTLPICNSCGIVGKLLRNSLKEGRGLKSSRLLLSNNTSPALPSTYNHQFQTDGNLSEHEYALRIWIFKISWKQISFSVKISKFVASRIMQLPRISFPNRGSKKVFSNAKTRQNFGESIWFDGGRGEGWNFVKFLSASCKSRRFAR